MNYRAQRAFGRCHRMRARLEFAVIAALMALPVLAWLYRTISH